MHVCVCVCVCVCVLKLTLGVLITLHLAFDTGTLNGITCSLVIGMLCFYVLNSGMSVPLPICHLLWFRQSVFQVSLLHDCYFNHSTISSVPGYDFLRSLLQCQRFVSLAHISLHMCFLYLKPL